MREKSFYTYTFLHYVGEDVCTVPITESSCAELIIGVISQIVGIIMLHKCGQTFVLAKSVTGMGETHYMGDPFG